MKSKMAHYYGWDDSYLESLDLDLFMDYWIGISVIQSEDALSNITANCFPNYDKSDRSNLEQRLKNISISTVDWPADKVLNSEEAAEKIMELIGNG